MSQDTSAYIGRALKVLKKALTPFVEARLKSHFGDPWRDEVRKYFNPAKRFTLDSYGLLKMMKVLWNQAFDDLDRSVLADVRETLSVRNQHAHDEVFNRKQADTALVTINRLIEAVGKKELDARRFTGNINSLRQELNAESQPRVEQVKSRTVFPPTTSRPRMFPYLEGLVRTVEGTSDYRQQLFDSELKDMLNEARERGEQKARVVSKELCFRVVDDYVDGVMVMSSDAMWTVWEWQGSRPERVIYKSKGGFSNLLEIEFDTDNLPPEK